MKTNTMLKNIYFFVFSFLEEVYLGKIMFLHQKLILFGLRIRNLSKFLWSSEYILQWSRNAW